MHIKFVPASLLYGESVFWLMTLTFTPFYWHPDLERTKHRTAIDDLGLSKYLKMMNKLRSTWFLHTFWPALISTTQLIYLAIYVVLGLAFQSSILELFGVEKTSRDSLTYLALYYCPTIIRLSVLTTTISSLARIRNYRAWPTYDRANYFAVDKVFQRRVMLLCALSILPDCFFTAIETFVIFNLTCSAVLSDFFRSRATNWSSLIEFLSRAILFGLSMVNVITRHKPMIDLMYQSACIRRHFQCINHQVVSIEMTVETNRMFYAHGFTDFEARKAAAPGGQLVMSNPICKSAGRPEMMSNLAELTREMLAESKIKSSQQRHLLDENSAALLTNLNQLERHLTQVNLFMKKSDNESPTSVLGLAFGDLIVFFYSVLYRVRRGYSELFSWGTLISTAGIGIPTITLFVLGHKLERECRHLLNKLEVIYLQKQSHSLLYKQKSDSQFILARVFKLLQSMKFDCNGLMEINLFTLIRWLFYVAGAVFVVIQYDLVATS